MTDNTPPADPGTPPPADTGNTPPADPGTPPADPAQTGEWWKGKDIDDDTRDFLTKNGLTMDDPVEAARSAAKQLRDTQRKLGKGPNRLMDRPEEGQDLGEWMQANRDVFGIPQDVSGYGDIKPDDFEGQWDEDFAAKAAERAHALNMTPAQLKGVAALYAQEIETKIGGFEQQAEIAEQTMREDLAKEWGAQMEANLAKARQGMQLIAERAGLDEAAQLNLAAALSRKTTDATVARVFHVIAEMSGDDMPAGLNAGGAATTPAQARQKLAELQGKDGAYYKAVEAQNRAELDRLKPQMEMLRKIATQR